MSQIKLEKFAKKELIWMCKNCGLKVVRKNGKRRKEYPEIDVSKYSNSWAEFIEERRLLNAKVRQCKHEHKLWSPDYCKRCGKPISNPTNLNYRMGPICRCKVRKIVRQWELEQEIKELIK